MINDVFTAIKKALERMEKSYCKLSKLDYSNMDDVVKRSLLQNKYLERSFAYEFYHQLRKMTEEGEISFNGPIIQAEVDKRYQNCFKDGKIPDFIIHIPGSCQENANLAVIEFKLASNPNIKNDLKKLVEFKQNPHLKYKHGIEVVIGDTHSLRKIKSFIKVLDGSQGTEITIFLFNTDSWKVSIYEINLSIN